MVQIRHVPDAVHRRLKKKAAEAGQSLSEYLLREMERVARRPTAKEMEERLAALPPVPMPESAADIIRAGREEREEQLMRAHDRR